MADFEDERIAALKERNKGVLLDRALTFLGLALAGASAFFPWYVFFNEDKFGINVADSNASRDLPDWPARNVFSVSPLAMRLGPRQSSLILNEMDSTKAANIASIIASASDPNTSKDPSWKFAAILPSRPSNALISSTSRENMQ